MSDEVKCPNCGQPKKACFGLQGCWEAAARVAQAGYMPKQLIDLYEKLFIIQTELGSRSAEALHTGQNKVRYHLELAYSTINDVVKYLGDAIDVAE